MSCIRNPLAIFWKHAIDIITGHFLHCNSQFLESQVFLLQPPWIFNLIKTKRYGNGKSTCQNRRNKTKQKNNNKKTHNSLPQVFFIQILLWPFQTNPCYKTISEVFCIYHSLTITTSGLYPHLILSLLKSCLLSSEDSLLISRNLSAFSSKNLIKFYEALTAVGRVLLFMFMAQKQVMGNLEPIQSCVILTSCWDALGLSYPNRKIKTAMHNWQMHCKEKKNI